jgi:hypothetical protein
MHFLQKLNKFWAHIRRPGRESYGKNLFSPMKGDDLLMSRGEHFDHKRKGHPGKFPEGTLVERHSKDAIEDEEFIVVQEAFKNRVEED